MRFLSNVNMYVCICSAQTVDRDHPWIVLRKAWIGDIHALTRQTLDRLRKAWIMLAQSVDVGQTVDRFSTSIVYSIKARHMIRRRLHDAETKLRHMESKAV